MVEFCLRNVLSLIALSNDCATLQYLLSHKRGNKPVTTYTEGFHTTNAKFQYFIETSAAKYFVLCYHWRLWLSYRKQFRKIFHGVFCNYFL